MEIIRTPEEKEKTIMAMIEFLEGVDDIEHFKEKLQGFLFLACRSHMMHLFSTDMEMASNAIIRFIERKRP